MPYFEDDRAVYGHIGYLLRAAVADEELLGRLRAADDVVLTMDGDTAHSFWQGELNVAVALAKGQIKAHGPVATILRLVPLSRDLFPRYRELVLGGDIPPLDASVGATTAAAADEDGAAAEAGAATAEVEAAAEAGVPVEAGGAAEATAAAEPPAAVEPVAPAAEAPAAEEPAVAAESPA